MQLEGFAPAPPVELPLLGLDVSAFVEWLCGVAPLIGQGGLLRLAYVVMVCTTTRRGMGILVIPRAYGVGFTTKIE